MTLFINSEATPSAKAAFPGRNGRIVFQARTANPVQDATQPYVNDFDLFTVGPDGAGLVQLTSGPDADITPDWAPDGRAIAFTRVPGDVFGDIYVMDSEGALVNLTPNTPAFDDWGPTWSPDGKQIAFNSSRGELTSDSVKDRNDDGLYVMNADGTDVRQLADEFATGAEWSPDGDWIAVANREAGGIDLIGLSGARKRVVRFPSNVFYVDWSPDGKRLVFSTGALFIGGAPGDIVTVNVDGTRQRYLTRTDRTSEVSPNWSPDGRFIVFVSDRGGAHRLYRMHADGSHVIPLIDIQVGQDALLDWGPRP